GSRSPWCATAATAWPRTSGAEKRDRERARAGQARRRAARFGAAAGAAVEEAADGLQPATAAETGHRGARRANREAAQGDRARAARLPRRAREVGLARDVGLLARRLQPPDRPCRPSRLEAQERRPGRVGLEALRAVGRGRGPRIADPAVARVAAPHDRQGERLK